MVMDPGHNGIDDLRLKAMSAWVDESYEEVVRLYDLVDDELSHMEQRRLNYARSQCGT